MSKEKPPELNYGGFKWTNEQKPREKREWCIQVQMSYPVVVFQGLIYCVEDENGKAKITPVDRL